MDNGHRFPAPDAPAVGLVRGLPHTYEVTALGGAISRVPAGNWQRGQIVRSASAPFHLSTPTPMYDPSDPAQRLAQGWAS